MVKTAKTGSESKHSVTTSLLNGSEKNEPFFSSQEVLKPFFSPVALQPKLKIGQPNDKYEQDADRVADAVMRMPDSTIQRKCEACEKEEKLQKKAEVKTSGSDQAFVDHKLSTQIKYFERGGSALPKNIQTEMGDKIGADFSQVNIHTDSKAAQMNWKLGAKAFTHGSDIYFNEGQYDPSSTEGKHLLAHELAHVVQQRSVPEYLACQTDVHAELTGHASPRWEHTHGARRSVLNMQLSEDRVESVQLFFEEMLGNALRERGLDARITYESRNVEESDPVGAPGSTSLSAEAVGSSVTEEEAGGDMHINRPDMRRVDVKVTVTWQVPGEALSSESEDVIIPENCEPNATERWAIKIALSGGAGHAGVGAAGALGVLKNRLTGQTAQGSFQGGGLGVGLSTPGADPGWGDFTNFTTDSRVTFEDFDGILARLTTAGGGIAIIGGGLAWISFPTLGANSIFVGGFNMGQLGADMGSNVGTWNVIGRPPGPICTPEHTEHREYVHSEPYNTAMPNEFDHRVLFETGSAEISDEELLRLQQFVDEVMANYEYSGIEETRMAE